MSYLSLSSLRDPVVRPFVVRGCLPSAHLAGTTAAPIGRIRGHLFLHRCIRRSSNCIWFAFPHYQRLRRVSLMCFRVASRLCLSYTYDVYALVSLGLLLRIGDSFLTRNFRVAT
jgi:hypothetical protein